MLKKVKFGCLGIIFSIFNTQATPTQKIFTASAVKGTHAETMLQEKERLYFANKILREENAQRKVGPDSAVLFKDEEGNRKLLVNLILKKTKLQEWFEQEAEFSIQSISKPYSQFDVLLYQYEVEEYEREIKNSYILAWNDLFSRHGISLWAFIEKEPSSLTTQAQLSPKEIRKLSKDESLARISLADTNSPVPTSFELINWARLSPYSTPGQSGDAVPAANAVPANQTLWGQTWGSTWRGNGIRIATAETGIPQSMANGFGIPLGNVVINNSVANRHSQVTFTTMARAATAATRYHFLGSNFSVPSGNLQSNQVRIFSSSFFNQPGRGGNIATFADFIGIVNAGNWATPLLTVGPADNCGETATCDAILTNHSSLVGWSAWAPLVVGNVQPNGRMANLWHVGGTGRCSSSENWPSPFGNPLADYELPNMVAHGWAGGALQNPTTWDDWIHDPLMTAAPGEGCGTSLSAPLTVGTVASLMTNWPEFTIYPELGKAAAMLNAVNAWGQDQYTTWNPNDMVPCGGSTCMNIIDGVDGTGALDALQAGEWVNTVRTVRSWPSGHPSDDNVARESGAAFFRMRKGLAGGFSGDLFNADNPYTFQIRVPASLNGRHLRCLLVWQPRVNGGAITVDDFDLEITNNLGQVQRVPNDAQGLTWDSNVEVIDWWPTAAQLGTTLNLVKRNTAPNMATGNTIRAVVAWAWVRDRVQPLAQDIGNPALAGTVDELNGTYTVRGNGTRIDQTSDQFHYGHQILNGDGTITARLVTQSFGAVSGIMIRESLNSNSRHAFLGSLTNGQVVFRWRSATGGTTTTLIASTSNWFRLRRTGNTITAFRSSNGSNWFQVGTPQVFGTFSSHARAGLAAASNNNTTHNTAQFSNVRVIHGDLP